ncbi:MAG: DUF5615 family PIN-like protein [Fimbriimonadales bacterium]|nr:DUF5615 family PIN-like protein [Fimbriimonadales bacterium]
METIKILVDACLPAEWCIIFRTEGWEAVHWSEIGALTAPDEEIMQWARQHGYIIFTHDMDFSTLLALTGAGGPSVLQMRTQDVMPATHSERVVNIIRKYSENLLHGAIITIDYGRDRIRILPISTQKAE